MTADMKQVADEIMQHESGRDSLTIKQAHTMRGTV